MSKNSTSNRSATDWDRVDAMDDDDIDFSDCPEIPPSAFARSIVRNGLKPVIRKQQITMRIDADVLTWFQNQGRGYQTKINTILKAYKDAHTATNKHP